MAKKKNNQIEEETLEQIGEELVQEQQAEAAETAKSEIEPDVPIIIETSTRVEAQEKVLELKTKAASIGLCKMESTPIQFIKQDYLDEGHFKVKLIFTK